jgi:hypothetical protein
MKSEETRGRKDVCVWRVDGSGRKGVGVGRGGGETYHDGTSRSSIA